MVEERMAGMSVQMKTKGQLATEREYAELLKKGYVPIGSCHKTGVEDRRKKFEREGIDGVFGDKVFYADGSVVPDARQILTMGGKL